MLRPRRAIGAQGQQEEKKQHGGAGGEQPVAKCVARKPGADQLVVGQRGEDFFQNAFAALLVILYLFDARLSVRRRLFDCFDHPLPEVQLLRFLQQRHGQGNQGQHQEPMQMSQPERWVVGGQRRQGLQRRAAAGAGSERWSRVAARRSFDGGAPAVRRLRAGPAFLARREAVPRPPRAERRGDVVGRTDHQLRAARRARKRPTDQGVLRLEPLAAALAGDGNRHERSLAWHRRNRVHRVRGV